MNADELRDKLLKRGFSITILLNNRGLIGAIMDEYDNANQQKHPSEIATNKGASVIFKNQQKEVNNCPLAKNCGFIRKCNSK